jgi:lipoprotein-anchoring transpeptidase ErfK/SrfK
MALPSLRSRIPRDRVLRTSVALVLTALLAILGLAPAVSAQTTTTVDPTTTTTTVPETPPAPPAPPAPKLSDIFPGIDPSITVEQLEAFFRWIQGPPVPANSGSGRRIVYSNSAQRVWLVNDDNTVNKTYLVSGRTGLPALGTYHVYSKSRYAQSGSARMEYMVRFAHGRNLAIGFHTIPLRANGTPLQSAAELGYPRSHGCVRQNPPDAIYLFMWAPVGTTVVAVR